MVGSRLKATNADVYFIVDEEDYLWLKGFKISVNGKGYGYTYVSEKKSLELRIPWSGTWAVHNLILAKHQLLKFARLDCDHIDRDILNNTKCNLRQVSRSENMKNNNKRLARSLARRQIRKETTLCSQKV